MEKILFLSVSLKFQVISKIALLFVFMELEILNIPKTKGLTVVKSVSGLNFVTRLVGRKEEVQFEASELRFEK